MKIPKPMGNSHAAYTVSDTIRIAEAKVHNTRCSPHIYSAGYDNSRYLKFKQNYDFIAFCF